eukprot:SAG11_NODE_17484_length_517_cov_1.023923_1_plen_33_part_01
MACRRTPSLRAPNRIEAPEVGMDLGRAAVGIRR